MGHNKRSQFVFFIILSVFLIIGFQNCNGYEAISQDVDRNENDFTEVPSQIVESPADDSSSPVDDGPDIVIEDGSEIDKIDTETCSLDNLEEDYPCVTIHYGTDTQHHYDIWLPHSITPESKVPLVVYTHGGGYKGGKKEYAYRTYVGMEKFLKAGFAFATIEYRLSGDFPYEKTASTPYPPAMTDAAAALQDMKARAPHYGYDRDKVALIGASAGGGISLWLGLHDDLKDSSHENPMKRQSTRVQCVAISGTQTTLHIEEIEELFTGSSFNLDGGVPGLYGIPSPEDYHQNTSFYLDKFAASMHEASPISHLSPDDKGKVKILLTYARGFGEGNIHSPEFGEYIANGNPSLLAQSFSRTSLSALGVEHTLRIDQGNERVNFENIYDYVSQECF